MNLTITIYTRKNGALFDAVSPPTIGTIIRVDTGETVASGITMTRQSLGTYYYTLAGASYDLLYQYDVTSTIGTVTLTETKQAIRYSSPEPLHDPIESLTIAQAQEVILNHARNYTDQTAYTTFQVRCALDSLLSRFCRVTKILRGTFTLTPAANTGIVTLPSMGDWPALRPENIINGVSTADGALLAKVDWDNFITLSAAEEVADPAYITAVATQTGCDCRVYPASGNPSPIYVNFWYYTKMWDLDGAGGEVISIPRNYLMEILPTGGAWMLHQSEPENMKIAELMRAKYLEIEKELKNVTAIAGASFVRS